MIESLHCKCPSCWGLRRSVDSSQKLRQRWQRDLRLDRIDKDAPTASAGGPGTPPEQVEGVDLPQATLLVDYIHGLMENKLVNEATRDDMLELLEEALREAWHSGYDSYPYGD